MFTVQCVMCIKEANSGSPPVIRHDWEGAVYSGRKVIVSLCTADLGNNSPLQLVAADHVAIAVVLGTRTKKK